MSEEIQSQPNPQPEPQPPAIPRASFKAGFGPHLAGGIGMAVLSIVFGFVMESIIPFSIFALGALVSLFFPGRRGIAAGFFLTFGVIILLFIMICGAILTMG